MKRGLGVGYRHNVWCLYMEIKVLGCSGVSSTRLTIRRVGVGRHWFWFKYQHWVVLGVRNTPINLASVYLYTLLAPWPSPRVLSMWSPHWHSKKWPSVGMFYRDWHICFIIFTYYSSMAYHIVVSWIHGDSWLLWFHWWPGWCLLELWRQIFNHDVIGGQCDVTVSGDVTQVTNNVIVTSNIFLIVNRLTWKKCIFGCHDNIVVTMVTETHSNNSRPTQCPSR